MALPLLETKLYAPARRLGVVPRSRLTDQLDLGAGSKLTLISAPAGFGKTTLLADWLAGAAAHRRSVAWLALDPADNEPRSFWSYVVAALQTATPGVGQRTRLLLEAPRTPVDVVLKTLLNEFGAVPEHSLLVLDDYHVIEAPEIQEQMAFLLDHLPPRVHLMIATRADPALPLSRLRARAQLVEIRAADLRFTAQEAAAYLNDSMGLDLTVPDVEALEGRTEGWIAGLQLAALSIRGRSDVAEFIAGFAGDHRYIVDYLVEEVLRRQPERVRSFLLQTSILSRLTGLLCDAVTGRDGGKAMLEELDRANLFLIPLDDQRRWYRYHHLFADMLQARLLDEQPDQVPELHRHASEWYEQDGQPHEAIRHALMAGDFERAADLVELAIPEMRRGRQEARLRRWLEALPQELFPARPVLSVGYVGALMSTGEFEGIEALLRDAERWLETPGEAAGSGVPTMRMVVRDVPELRRLPGAIAMYRAALAQVRSDVAGMTGHARRALALVDEDDHLGRGGAAALLGLAYWADGDLDAATRWYADGMASLEQAGHLADVVGGVITLADIGIAQGRLHDAMRLFDRALQVSSSDGGSALRGAADVHVGLSDLFRERNDLEAASRHLLASRELGDENGMPRNPYRWRVAAARIQQARGDLDGAVELLDEAERLYVSDFAPDVRPVAAVKARVLVAQGKLSEAWGWAREHGLTAGDELQYVHEFEHTTLARLLLAQGMRDGADESIGAAIGLTERLLVAAQRGGRNGSAIDITVVQALAHHAIGDRAAALTSLEHAVELAEPEGYVRIFVDEGLPMTALLKLAARARTASTYLRGLLAAAVTAGARTELDQQPLIEPLSERELEVLRLLGSELDGPEIARELSVSLNTVRTHTKSVYAKLGVHSRRAAVRRAAELDLLARPRDRRPTD